MGSFTDFFIETFSFDSRFLSSLEKMVCSETERWLRWGRSLPWGASCCLRSMPAGGALPHSRGHGPAIAWSSRNMLWGTLRYGTHAQAQGLTAMQEVTCFTIADLLFSHDSRSIAYNTDFHHKMTAGWLYSWEETQKKFKLGIRMGEMSWGPFQPELFYDPVILNSPLRSSLEFFPHSEF